MTPEQWQAAKKVLADALELAPDKRPVFLDKICTDPDFRREVESLISAHEKASVSFLEPPALHSATLEKDSKLGQYTILARIGAGGMGEVYRARDTKLARDVALKVLPAAFSRDSERMARFQREAKVLASLNHPHIAAIYGLEDSDGTSALVMELVEGPTLAERIRKRSGPVPMDEALRVARQMAEALEYAHERGIVHRDLKPANMKVTPDDAVKVLDFGLAKAVEGEAAASSVENSPTISAMATQPGVIWGTAAYMAPEQAEGKQADRRADIWAFGCVLYEMLTGKRAFPGDTVTETLAAVLAKEPEWASLPAATPVRVRVLLQRCLQKQPKQRLQAIGDARIAIDEVLSGAPDPALAAIPQKHPLWRRALPWALGLIAILSVAIAGYLLFQSRKAQSVVRFLVPAPERTNLRMIDAYPTLSPDGSKLAFLTGAQPGTQQMLWVRSFDSPVPQALPGTEDALYPFWSPDGRYLGFYSHGKLQKVSLSDGSLETIGEYENLDGGATWNRAGEILFTKHNALYRVSERGGSPVLVAAPDASRHEISYLWPQFLPDGQHFLLLIIIASQYGDNIVAVGSLDSLKPERLLQSTTSAVYAAPGYLFYMNENTLMAQPFDAARLRKTGQAAPVATGIGSSAGPSSVIGSNSAAAMHGYFTASQTGVLAYQTGAGAGVTNGQMAWFDRKGAKVGAVSGIAIRSNPALSPDGGKIAVGVGPRGSRDIWVYDLRRGTESRLTFGNTGDNFNPVWSADGSLILFSSTRAHPVDIYRQASNGLGDAAPAFQSKEQDQNKALNDVIYDGRFAIYDTGFNGNSTQLWVLPLQGDRKPFPFIQSNFAARSARFSPNGRYVAYTSNETGRFEIYVQTFPEHQGKWQISTSGGLDPSWRSDGKELFYVGPKDELMAVDVDTGSQEFQSAPPTLLFQASLVPAFGWRNRYVVSANGQRFLMLVPAGDAVSPPITVVLNWPSLLR